MTSRPAKKANTAVAKKANERALTPERKAYRKGARDASRLASMATVCMQKELQDQVIEQAVKILMQQRTIARLLCLLSEEPSEEIRRANAEIVRLHEQLGTTKGSS
jgi:hypothetical protein